SEGEGSVEGQIGEYFELVVLCDERFGALLEGVEIFFGPPVTHYAVAVESASLVVETVSDFVSDYRSDCAVVDGVVGFKIEERRLQDGSWEYDFVERWVVVSVDGLR